VACLGRGERTFSAVPIQSHSRLLGSSPVVVLSRWSRRNILSARTLRLRSYRQLRILTSRLVSQYVELSSRGELGRFSMAEDHPGPTRQATGGLDDQPCRTGTDERALGGRAIGKLCFPASELSQSRVQFRWCPPVDFRSSRRLGCRSRHSRGGWISRPLDFRTI
jgi:hypothetical protein